MSTSKLRHDKGTEILEKNFLHLFHAKIISFFGKWYQSYITDDRTNFTFADLLYRSYIRKGKSYINSISGLKEVISNLYHSGKWRQKTMEQWYHSFISGYITFTKSTITVLYPVWYRRKKIWNSYITVLYLDISLLQKALSQCYTLPGIGISRYGTRLIFLLMVFCCRRISQTCHFLPQEKFPVKPSAFESEIHPSHKSKICTLGISPCRGLTAIRRICS